MYNLQFEIGGEIVLDNAWIMPLWRKWIPIYAEFQLRYTNQIMWSASAINLLK